MCIAGIRIELRPGLIAGGPTTFDELSQRATGLADWVGYSLRSQLLWEESKD